MNQEHNNIEPRATKDSWQNLPMDKPWKVEYEMHFTHKQFQMITKGLIPEEMEDKWFIYFEGDWLYCHRSWTGHCLFKAQILKESDAYVMKEFYVERNNNKYSNQDDDYNSGVLTFLITQGLLGIEFRDEFFKSLDPTSVRALQNWSMFGRMLFRE